MNLYKTEKNNLFNSTLAESHLDSKVMQMWSRHQYDAAPFYTTGFETILFNKENSFVLETVLASSVDYDNEILIVGSGKSMAKLKNMVTAQNLTYHCFDWSSDGWDDFENKVSKMPYISHMLIGIDSETAINDIPVEKLLSLASKRRYSLIAYCDTIVDGLNDIFNGAIDFMIGVLNNLRSFVVARRSRLVQTEGNSRCFNRDLYSYWQWAMRDRKSLIEPMRI